MRRSAFGLFLVCAVAHPQPPVILKSETKVVAVDVVVTDKKGAYVHDLTAKDFKLWDDNKQQTIQSFSLESAQSSAAPAHDTDYMVIAFDNAGMDAGDQIRARQAAAGFIDANAGPNRRIAVANFDGGLKVMQSFTGNAGRLKETVTGSRSGAVMANNSQSGTGAITDLASRDRFVALRNLASSLAAAPGRKTILLLTGSLVAGADQKGFLADAIAACNRANVAVYPVDVRDVSLPSTTDVTTAPPLGRGAGLSGMLNSTGGRAGRGSANMKGDTDSDVTDDPSGVDQQVLYAIATGTGGFVIRNANELSSGLQKVGQEQEEYYVLGFSPAETKAGTCHALKVKLERSGLNVRARSGYCDEKQPELISANTTANDLEKRAAASQPGNIAASMRLPFFYLSEGVARVNVAMEIQPNAIKFEKKKTALHADVSILGIASTASGEVGGQFNDTLTLDFDEADQSWKTKSIHYEKEFKIAPGQYNMTVVFSAGGESFGKVTEPLTIEPYQPGHFAISGLALGKDIRKDGAGDSPLAASLFDDRTVLKINGVELIPAGSLDFDKGAQAYCYFEIYPAPDSPALTLQMRILDANNGEAISDAGSGNLQAPAGKTTVPVGLGLPFAKLAPGSYRLQVSVADAAGHQAQRTASFQIK